MKSEHTVLAEILKGEPDASLAAHGGSLTTARQQLDAELEIVKAELRKRHPGLNFRLEIPDGLGKVCVMSPTAPTLRLRPGLPSATILALYTEHPDLFDLQVRPRPNLDSLIQELEPSVQEALLDKLDMETELPRISFGQNASKRT